MVRSSQKLYYSDSTDLCSPTTGASISITTVYISVYLIWVKMFHQVFIQLLGDLVRLSAVVE